MTHRNCENTWWVEPFWISYAVVESRMHWLEASRTLPEAARLSYPLYYSRIVMTFTKKSTFWLLQCPLQVFLELVLLNRVRNIVCQWYHDSILLKKSRLRRAEKNWNSMKHIWNSIYEEFKSRVNQSLAAAEHKSRYVCPNRSKRGREAP